MAEDKSRTQLRAAVEEPLRSNFFSPLEFENVIFMDCLADDGLLVVGPGMCVDRIIFHIIRVHCDSGNLVIVLNIEDEEQRRFQEMCRDAGLSPLPTVISAEAISDTRQKLYLQGGVFFVSSRILIVDFLTKRIPAHLITGILVNKAHKVDDSSQEAFILRLYRERNNTGFIKAFSESPNAFMHGFCKVEKVMKNLFISSLHLWPRFHSVVSSFFEKHSPEVVEIHVELSHSMKCIQTAILDLIKACLREIKQVDRTIDEDELTLESCLTRSFDRTICTYLDSVWNQLRPRMKQLLSDIKVLKMLLGYLFKHDAVTFLGLLESLRRSQQAASYAYLWMLMDASNQLFLHARSRVCPFSKTGSAEKPPAESDFGEGVDQCPKWKAFCDIIHEIKAVKLECGTLKNVLVVASDRQVCAQLRQLLVLGPREVIAHNLRRYQQRCGGTQVDSRRMHNDSRTRSTRSSSASGLGPKRVLEDTEDVINPMDAKTYKLDPDWSYGMCFDAVDELGKDSVTSDLEDGELSVVFLPLRDDTDRSCLMDTLWAAQPNFVLLYDAEVAFVRQLELYKALRPGVAVRVYFVMYSGSVEEQIYLTSLRKEKEAFEALIQQKATMLIPAERLCRDEISRKALRASVSSDEASTRIGGGREPPSTEPMTVVVDMREFRCELPSHLYRRGIDIEPVTLEIGDYVLTPDVCVERKSLSDLIGSLNSGRLYNQVVAMSRHYKKPVLLIEFDARKPFLFQGRKSVGLTMTQAFMLKLTLLTLHFPRLRILWSPSPSSSAELFEVLKRNQANPVPANAAKVSSTSDDHLYSDKTYNVNAVDFLARLPGVNSKNLHALTRSATSVADLVEMSEQKLRQVLENNENARSLNHFLHAPASLVLNENGS